MARRSETVGVKKARTGRERPDGKTARSTYSPKEKAEAIAMLLAGETPIDIEAKLGIPDSTVYDWAKELGGIEALRTGRLDELLYNSVKETLETLAAQSRFARNEQWLEKQTANDLAILYGVLSDKSVRVLAAIERASQLPGPNRGAEGAGAAAGSGLGSE